MEESKQTAETALVLRCCNADMSSKNGFVWPGVGGVATAKDWIDNTECGNGLHGWLYGQGDHSTSDYFSNVNAKWLVVKVVLADVRMLGGKCKFPSGEVVFVGRKSEAAKYIIENEPQSANVAVIGAVLECGDNGVLQGGALSVLTGGNSSKMTGGDSSTMTGGNSSTMTGGNYATMTGGDSSTMTGGNSSKMTGGNYATMTGGNYATMTGGDSSKMTGGNSSKMTGGNYATMTGGNYATMTGGDSSKMTGGNYATMTGGDSSTMSFKYYDGKRSRTVLAYVGEDGIEPNVAYRLNDDYKVVKVE